PNNGNVPWIVNIAGQVLRRTGNTTNANSSWEMLPGSASDIAAGFGFAWALGTQPTPGGFNIMAWNQQGDGGFTGDQAPEVRFDSVGVPGGGNSIAIGNGRPLITNDAG